MMSDGGKETAGDGAPELSAAVEEGGGASALAPSPSGESVPAPAKRAKASRLEKGQMVEAYDHRMWRPGLAVILEVEDEKLGVLRLHVFKDSKVNSPGISDGLWSPEGSKAAITERRYWKVLG